MASPILKGPQCDRVFFPVIPVDLQALGPVLLSLKPMAKLIMPSNGAGLGSHPE